MQGKKSFILYTDLIHTVKKLNREQRGDLLMTILEYVNDENPVIEDILIDLVFEPIKQGLKRDLNKWQEFTEKQKLNGSKGGRPKKDEEKPKEPKPFVENPKKPMNVSVNVNDNVTVNVTEKRDNLSPQNFYLSEIESNKDHEFIEGYKEIYFVMFKGELKNTFSDVVKIKEQISFKNYLVLREKEKECRVTVIEKLAALANSKKSKNYKNLYITMLNWMNPK